MKMFVTAVALVAGVALASGATAQSSSSPSQPSGAPPSGSAQQSGVLVDANSIVGATVRSQGKDIGKVDRLMVDPKDGRVRSVVIQMGGTLGVGGKSVSMPWESVKVAQDGDRIIVSAEQQMLEQAPAASPRTDSKSDSSDSKK
jgi:sporulation protein YlmC with PRC-barrel domain